MLVSRSSILPKRGGSGDGNDSEIALPTLKLNALVFSFKNIKHKHLNKASKINDINKCNGQAYE